MIAIEMKSGNFSVMVDETSVGPVAVIVKSERGWRVMGRTTTRGNSRTYSETPEQAASKYFSHKVTFFRAATVNLVASAMGVK